MKARLNITVEDKLLNSAKQYAERHNISLSELISYYFTQLTRRKKGNNIIDLVEQLPKPKYVEGDLKKSYYEDKKKKYGF
jgi:hypothetical protein